MKSIAIIGAGVSGLSAAQCLKNRFSVKVFEKESLAGGLIKCERVEGFLYHRVGGHVFNSKRADVLEWFWKFFNCEKEFVRASRNAAIAVSDGKFIGYPIENHIYMLGDSLQKRIIADLLKIVKDGDSGAENFEDFLLKRFGSTLFEIYFRPYNEKIWKTELKNIPLSWLEGKLPMPKVEEIIMNNFNHINENTFVHSNFYYPLKDGSQFVADRLAENLNIVYNQSVNCIKRHENRWIVNNETFDKVIFCGNLKELPEIMRGDFPENYLQFTENMAFHGTTTVLCETEKNPYSWVYLPSADCAAHRIICTGNFSKSNNAAGKMSATVEFTDELSQDEIFAQLDRLPFKPRYITHFYTPCSYPVQTENTRKTVGELKNALASANFFLTGRFAEWEYYNMDAAIGASMDLSNKILKDI